MGRAMNMSRNRTSLLSFWRHGFRLRLFAVVVALSVGAMGQVSASEDERPHRQPDQQDVPVVRGNEAPPESYRPPDPPPGWTENTGYGQGQVSPITGVDPTRSVRSSTLRYRS